MLTTAMLLLRGSLFLSLHLAGSASSFPKPLSAEEEQTYLARCVQGDLEARNVLVERNIKNGYPEGKILPGIQGRGGIAEVREEDALLLACDAIEILIKKSMKGVEDMIK